MIAISLISVALAGCGSTPAMRTATGAMIGAGTGEVNLQEIFEERFAALEAKIEELSKKLEGADVEAEKMRDAIKLSAQVLEVLASEPSAEPIQKPVSYAKEIKNEKTDKFNRLQKAFQNLKNK